MTQNNLKALISQIIAKYGSLRAAGAALGVDYSKLYRLSHNGGLAGENIEFLEKVRIALKIKKANFWDKLL